MAASYAKIANAAKSPSAAGDIALLTGYMKLIDPGSTVREGEFRTAQFAASVPERLKAFYNQILSGERLTDETRKDFLNQARILARTQRETQKQIESQYAEKSNRLGLNKDEVVTDFFAGMDLDSDDEKALAWAKKNPMDPRAQEILRLNGGK